jgi:predicted DNA-binding WGR domain protein
MSVNPTAIAPFRNLVFRVGGWQSHKFYEVTVHETEVTIRYGRIGTVGQLSRTTYAAVEKA